jgi:acyl carrier protein
VNIELIREKTYAAILNASESTKQPSAHDSLVFDLGFDSMRMAMLSIALEVEFGAVILLNDWISSVDDLDQLTVESLVGYVAGVMTSIDTEESGFESAVP